MESTTQLLEKDLRHSWDTWEGWWDEQEPLRVQRWKATVNTGKLTQLSSPNWAVQCRCLGLRSHPTVGRTGWRIDSHTSIFPCVCSVPVVSFGTNIWGEDCWDKHPTVHSSPPRPWVMSSKTCTALELTGAGWWRDEDITGRGKLASGGLCTLMETYQHQPRNSARLLQTVLTTKRWIYFMYGCFTRQTRVSDLLKLKVWMAVNHHESAEDGSVSPVWISLS